MREFRLPDKVKWGKIGETEKTREEINVETFH